MNENDYNRNIGNVETVLISLIGNKSEEKEIVKLYLDDGTHFITVEPIVANSVVKVIRSHGIKTKTDLLKFDWNFCQTLSFVGEYVLYTEHRAALGLIRYLPTLKGGSENDES